MTRPYDPAAAFASSRPLYAPRLAVCRLGGRIRRASRAGRAMLMLASGLRPADNAGRNVAAKPRSRLSRFAAGCQKSLCGRPRPRTASSCSWKAAPAISICSIPSRCCNKLAGQPLPDSFGPVITAMGEARAPLLASPRKWKQHGQCGTWVSEWLPHTAELVDHLAVIRSCVADGINHSAGVCQMNTGSILGGRPSLGSWVTYGLGTENTDLPAFVVMQDGSGQVVNGPRNWSAGFMPAVYQGIRIQGGKEPIPNLNTPEGVVEAQQRGKLDYLREMNARYARPASGTDRTRRPHRQLRAGLSHAGRSAGGRRPGRRNRGHAAGSTGSIRKKRPRWAANACSPGGWSSAACASCSSTTARAANGTPTASSKRITASSAGPWTCRSPACCAICRRAACWTKRWSSGAASSAARR